MNRSTAVDLRIERQVRRLVWEPILDFHLTVAPAAPHGGLEFDHYLEPASLDLALLFHMLSNDQGRMICRNVPRIRMRKISRPLKDGTHEAEVERIFYVAPVSAVESPHLRFVFDGGEQLRFGPKSDIVPGQDGGEEVFASTFLESYR